jgi:predicted ATPase
MLATPGTAMNNDGMAAAFVARCSGAVTAGVRDERMLLLFDNCEHVLDAAASLAAAVLIGAPGVNILATSREPLRVGGEHTHRGFVTVAVHGHEWE